MSQKCFCAKPETIAINVENLTIYIANFTLAFIYPVAGLCLDFETISPLKVNHANSNHPLNCQFTFEFQDLKEQTEKENSVGAISNVIEPEPEKSMSKKVSKVMTKSLSMVTMKTNETTDKLANGIMKKTKSLRSLRIKRKHSNEENMDSAQDVSVSEEKKPKIEDVKEPLENAQKVNIPGLTIQEQAFAKFAGVKNMLSSAVWGVPYAKVVEDPLDISVCDTEMIVNEDGVKDDLSKTGENPNNCVIA